jgi:hypothetical protein
MSKLDKLDSEHYYEDVNFFELYYSSLFPGVTPYWLEEEDPIFGFYSPGLKSDRHWLVVSPSKLSKRDLVFSEPFTFYLFNAKFSQEQIKAVESIFLEKPKVLAETACYVCIYENYIYGPHTSKAKVVLEILNEFRNDKHLVG